MKMDYPDDDENIRDMRATAKQIGLTDLLLRVLVTPDIDKNNLIRQALRLLGVSDERTQTRV